MNTESLYNFIMLCLKDDDGISEEAYQSLIEHLLAINEPDIVIEINSKSRTANGRRYINDHEDEDECSTEIISGVREALQDLRIRK